MTPSIPYLVNASDHASHPSYSRDLGNGFLLRWLQPTPEDLAKLANLAGGYGTQEGPDDPYDPWIAEKFSRYFHLRHPTALVATPYDCGVVEDTNATGSPAIALAVLFRHRLQISGVEFSVGQIEFVMTDYRYRRRGFQAAIHAMMHEKSEARGDLCQLINGIPYFYKQFGYDYSMIQNAVFNIPFDNIPQLPENTTEEYELVVAKPEDAHYFNLFRDRRQEVEQNLVWSPLDESYWHWHSTQYLDNPKTDYIVHMRLIRSIKTQNVVGCLLTWSARRSENITLLTAEFDASINVLTFTPVVLRLVQRLAEEVPYIGDTTPPPTPKCILFDIPPVHPLRTALTSLKLLTKTAKPRMWYTRVANYPALLQAIAPALEKRLNQSQQTQNHTGELTFNFYRHFCTFTIQDGKIKDVRDGKSTSATADEVSFPTPGIFNRMLFGHSSFAELEAFDPDVEASSPQTRVLIETMFPKGSACVYDWL